MLKSFQDIEEKLKKQHKRKTLVLSAANDLHALEAVVAAKSKGIIEAILVGNSNEIRDIAASHAFSLSGMEIIHEPDETRAVELSVQMVTLGKANILMKGKSSTATLLKGILNKEWGMRKGKLLSHFALFEIPNYHKLLALTDVAINLTPDLIAKTSILENAVSFMNSMGWVSPKVAVIAAVEVVNPAMQATIDAAELSSMADAGAFGSCMVAGPMALDSAINKESAIKKGITSPVGGDADLLLFPQLESGNIMYKSLAFLAGGQAASVVLGATSPVVLTSRADSEASKLNSIILAAAQD